MLEECYVYLKECLKIISVPNFYKENTVASRMRQLRQECKLKLQLCAVLSQTQNHTEAADNAKKSVKLVHQLFKDLFSLCTMYIRKIEHKDLQVLNKQNKKAAASGSAEQNETEKHQISILSTSPSQFQSGSGNFMEDSVSMLERTALKLYPIVKEVLKKMIEETASSHKI